MEKNDGLMRDYYRKRAPQYDVVYDYPERQKDLRFLEAFIPQQFKNLDVLEIAAGTGYWTGFIAREAKTILATDAEAKTLAQFTLSQKGTEKHTHIETRIADAYSLANVNEKFDGLFAGQWFSHIPIERRESFMGTVHSKLLPGARVIFIDNSIAQLERLPLNKKDKSGNTFQRRKLEDGSSHQVLKNFPNGPELESLVKHCSSDLSYKELDNFWLFQYIYSPAQ